MVTAYTVFVTVAGHNNWDWRLTETLRREDSSCQSRVTSLYLLSLGLNTTKPSPAPPPTPNLQPVWPLRNLTRLAAAHSPPSLYFCILAGPANVTEQLRNPAYYSYRSNQMKKRLGPESRSTVRLNCCVRPHWQTEPRLKPIQHCAQRTVSTKSETFCVQP